MITQAARTSYDEVPYPSHPFAQTHPDHLATLATLLGLRPPPADRCRVLELGCASGGNLLPMALALPDSSFLGIDLSAEQIGQGSKTVAALGLKNVELRHLGILDVDDSFGEFDYIICHGVYSWVPREVQDKILAICARHLAPDGVGYVSYNTHPGWHLRGMVRSMMNYHVSRYPGEPPPQRVARARALLAFLARSAGESDSPYAQLLREHQELLQQHSDSYLFHEHLEECNEPVWFLQFCERLTAHGLRYLGEAEFSTMVAGTSFPPEVQQELEALAPNLLEKEQYMDFLRNRTFRQTLLCHAHRRPNYDVRADRLAAFHVASPLRPKAAEPDLHAEAPAEFAAPGGLSLTTSVPLVKAALACLGEAWPRALAFDALRDQARARLGSAAAADTAGSDVRVLGRALLTAYARAGKALVELSLRPPRFAAEVSERPAASPLARLQAAGSPLVTSLRHETVHLTPFDRHLLPLLDGTRDRPALVEGLVERFRQAELSISQDEQPITDAARARAILAEVLERQLPLLARGALLVA
jgi:methyltransferase-like protein/ubiquinone/menaquinone biosynthesis C-methylase UbiE